MTLASIPISVWPSLAGQDRPVMSDGVLLVSPAMWSLMDGATEAELEHVVKNLFPIEIPGLLKPGRRLPR